MPHSWYQVRMLAAIAFLALSLQESAPAPILPPGTRPSFQKTYAQILGHLDKQEFAAAASLANSLPSKEIRIRWDDHLLPVPKRQELLPGKNNGAYLWIVKGGVIGLSDKGSPDIEVKFVASKGDRLVENGVPRVVLEIGTQGRTNPLTLDEVTHLVGRAVGAYFGVSDSPIPGSVMWTGEPISNRVMGTELSIANQTFKVSNLLREAVSKKKRLVADKVVAEVDSQPINLGTVPQGGHPSFSIKISNKGTGALLFRVVPDCNCFGRIQVGELAAGKSKNVTLAMDTIAYHGVIKKNIAVYTNDPDKPTTDVPVEVNVRPAYRFLREEGDVILLPDGGGTYDVILALPDDTKIMPLQTRFDGMDGSVKISPWTGTVADPEMNQPAMPRKGYLLKVKIEDTLPAGRAPGTISINTTDPDFPVLHYTLYAQKGIIAMPANLPLGEIGTIPSRAQFLISRPRKPFKVLSVSSTNSRFTVTFVEIRGGYEYKMDVLYDGKAPIGDLGGDVVITTDDPKQKEIRVPFSGTVSP